MSSKSSHDAMLAQTTKSRTSGSGWAPRQASRGSSTTFDKETKERPEAVLAAIGLTLSDAVRLMMIRIAQEGAMPFNPLIPNEETIEAMKEARAGKLVKVGLWTTF
jgi:DNA-damage-inducible protein J